MDEAALDLSIIMPCRNEEATVGLCIEQSRCFMKRLRLVGEILVIDNGSTDNSARIAAEFGARVITEPEPGYGRALRTGLCAGRGSVLILGDCDTTYDFARLDGIYWPLAKDEYDVMIGDRFAGNMEKEAMSLTHRIGVRALSALGRLVSGTDVHDFHCGLRGITKAAARSLPFKTTGMEFATEMIILAAQRGMKIGQTPVSLKKCRFDRKSKLRTLPDGARHLTYMLGNGLKPVEGGKEQ